MGLGFAHRAGWFQSGKPPFSSLGHRGRKYLQGFLVRGWNYPPGSRWSTINGARVSTPWGVVRTRGTVVFVLGALGCRTCKYMEGNPKRGSGTILPVLRWLYEPQPICDQYGWDFHTVRGGVDPGDHRFHSRGVGVVNVRRGLRTGDRALYPPRARREIGRGWACLDQLNWGSEYSRISVFSTIKVHSYRRAFFP